MPAVSRRRFLQLAGGSVAATMLSDSIARALAIPANRATRSLKDVEHIVVLMQENRSFDHYYGVMRGVRGFGDPHPVTLPSGQPVWYQAEGATVVPPFRPDVGNLALTFIEDLDHSWDGTHKMFNGGNWDQWLPAKTTTCMAHMERSDLPFHYALADAFTVCDGYHCSMLGPTDTNRYYMWTGWDGNDGKDGGPVIANDELGYGWQTYPERLQEAGISWKIYQDIGEGLDKAGVWGFTTDPYIGNYGDTSLLYFFNYQNATPGSPLYQRARTGTDVNHERRLLRHPRRRRQARPAAEGVLDRRARGVHRASGVARRLRRLVHRRGAQRADQRPRGVVKDGPADHLRRERWVLRPRDRAVPQRGRPRRALDGVAGQRTVQRHRRAPPAAQTESSGRTVSAYVCRC